MSKTAIEKAKAAIATQGEAPKPKTLRESLEEQRPEIDRALPSGMDADRFARIVLTTVKASPKLMKCTTSSVVAGCMLAAQLGLEPGPLGLSYLVPYWNNRIKAFEAQVQIGYKGIINLARRSGEIKDIQARTVFQADEFEHEYGLNPKLIHRPNHDVQSDPRVYYLLVRFLSGGEYITVAAPWKIEEHRLRSKSANDGPWVTDHEAMAWKTLVQMAKPWLPLTVEANQALQLDGAVVNEISKDMVEEQAAQREFIDVESSEIGDEPAEGDATTEPKQAPAANDDDPGRPFT